jgi:hypothetical protein
LRLIATQLFSEIGSVKRCVSSPEVHLPSRTTKFASALFAGLLAGVPLTTASHGAPASAEADKCLAGPKGTAPEGGHWYYRVERGTKRHCWYLGDEKEKVTRAAPAISSASANSASPASPPENAAAQRTIADARAELPPPQMPVEPQTGTTGQRAVAPAANAVGADTNQRANAWDTNTQSSPQSSVIASRWPESSGVSPSASPAPAPAPATYQSAATVQPDAAAPAPAIAPVTLAAADSSAAKQTGSIQTLLLVIIGALSLAGLMGTVIFRFGRMRWTGGRDISRDHRDRRAIWDSVSPSPIAYPSSGAPMPAAEILRETRAIPRETRAVDDPNRRITEMLARLSRTAAT